VLATRLLGLNKCVSSGTSGYRAMHCHLAKVRVFVLFFLGIFLSVISHADQLVAATSDWHPYAMETDNGVLEGISVDILREIASRTQHEVDISLMTPKRLHLQFSASKIDINFADTAAWNQTVNSPEFVFSEPYTTVSEYIYFLQNHYIEVKEPNDLRGKVVGINRGYYYAEFDDLFTQDVIRRTEAQSNEHLLTLLSKNRVQAAFFDDVLFNTLLSQSGLERDLFKRGKRLTNLSLALKFRVEKKHLLKGVNEAIADMKADGSIDKIINRYLSR